MPDPAANALVDLIAYLEAEDDRNKSRRRYSGTRILADRLGVSSSAVAAWKRVPASRVLQVERLTGGAVPRTRLRPDLYPPR